MIKSPLHIEDLFPEGLPKRNAKYPPMYRVGDQVWFIDCVDDEFKVSSGFVTVVCEYAIDDSQVYELVVPLCTELLYMKEYDFFTCFEDAEKYNNELKSSWEEERKKTSKKK